jgi:hypothetical protein
MPAITVDLPAELYERLLREAKGLGKTPQGRMTDILAERVGPANALKPETMAAGLAKLRTLLSRIPGVRVLSVSRDTEPYWWLKLTINQDSRIAWHVIQELGFVLNDISLGERLPTIFMPVSPPPYLNGGPRDFLGWVIEAQLPYIHPGEIADILMGRLPQPVEDETQWLATDSNEDDGDEEA